MRSQTVELAMSEPTRIIIADGHPLMREGLRAALERCADFRVVAEAGDGFAAVLAAASHRPDVVILDSAVPRLDAVDAVTRLRAQNAALRILVSLNSSDSFEVHEFMQAGADGVLARNTQASEFIGAVRAVVSGGAYLSGSLVGRLISRGARGPQAVNTFGLTPREIEILRLIGSGFSNKDMARRLDLSVRTVETHRLNIRKKTNATRFKDLLEIARRLSPEKAAASQSEPVVETALTMMM